MNKWTGKDWEEHMNNYEKNYYDKKQKEDIELTFFNSDVTTNYFGQGVSLEMLTRDELKKYLEDISNLAQKKNWLRMVVKEYLAPTTGWDEDVLIRRLKEVKKDIRLVQKRLLTQKIISQK